MANRPDHDRPQRRDRLAELNAGTAETFVDVLGSVVEHGAWVIEQVAPQRPFESLECLCAAITAEILSASETEQLSLLRGHPELAGAEAIHGCMTADSTGEQGRLGLISLRQADHRWLQAQNASYHARHGFPYIVALWRHENLESVFADLTTRLPRETRQELQTALREIGYVSRARVMAIMLPDNRKAQLTTPSADIALVCEPSTQDISREP
jgi:2-oxo-4-hydroxy-4-carboxy-5-ureidoimidazoline decarboxylase